MADDDEAAEALDLIDIHLADEDIEPLEDEELDEEWWEAAPDPTAYSTFAAFRAAVGTDKERDVHDPWQVAYQVSSAKKKKFGSDGKKFIKTVEEFIDSEVARFFKKIRAKKKRYKDKNWKLTPADLATEWTRIELLEDVYREVMDELRAGATHGDDLLVLGNVVWNEAGIFGDKAMKAIAYAYLNRKKGTMSPPVGKEISGYRPLRKRWKEFKDDGERLSFLENFGASLSAARTRLGDSTPSLNDPTKDATHWVSPKNLSPYDPGNADHVANRYKRTFKTHADRGFPKWARDPATQEAKDMQQAGELGPKFDEFPVIGVPAEHFLFYTDVKY